MKLRTLKLLRHVAAVTFVAINALVACVALTAVAGPALGMAALCGVAVATAIASTEE